MHLIKQTLVFILPLLLTACIKTYEPVIDSEAGNKYVISGRVTDIEGWQEVEISITSDVKKPDYKPVSFCQAVITDGTGKPFTLEEYKPGRYRVWMTQQDLLAGTSYKLTVNTPSGEMLESGSDVMPQGAELDSVYYFIEDSDPPTSDPASKGMQFYVDLYAPGNLSQYYKWEVWETWEYHAAHPAEYYYDGTFHEIVPPDYSKMVCYTTSLVKDVYTVTTKDLAEHTYRQFPLHRVDGRSPRLAILYSMLIRQFALNEGAYNYWEKMRVNSNEQGGLYEKQPVAVIGNLRNLTHPEKDVLGYFYAAAESSRRYFYQNVEGITLNFYNNCFEDGLGRGGGREYKTADYPVFFYYVAGAVRILDKTCIDCRLTGGVLEKPEFWPLDGNTGAK